MCVQNTFCRFNDQAVIFIHSVLLTLCHLQQLSNHEDLLHLAFELSDELGSVSSQD